MQLRVTTTAQGHVLSPGSRAQPGRPQLPRTKARPSPTRRWLAGGQDEQQAGAQGPGWAAPGASSGESPPARPIHSWGLCNRLFVAPLHGAIRRPAGAACLAPDPAFSGLGQTQAPLLQAGTGGASGRVRGVCGIAAREARSSARRAAARSSACSAAHAAWPRRASSP